MESNAEIPTVSSHGEDCETVSSATSLTEEIRRKSDDFKEISTLKPSLGSDLDSILELLIETEDDINDSDQKDPKKKKSKDVAPGSGKHDSAAKNYLNVMKRLIKESTRYFLIKSHNKENIKISQAQGVWATLPETEAKLKLAFRETNHVILIFSVNGSAQFCGFARLSSEPTQNGQRSNWSLPSPKSRVLIGNSFKITWISTATLSFGRTNHLYNPWNEGKLVKIGFDGQEIVPCVGDELIRLFPKDPRNIQIGDKFIADLDKNKKPKQVVKRPIKFQRGVASMQSDRKDLITAYQSTGHRSNPGKRKRPEENGQANPVNYKARKICYGDQKSRYPEQRRMETGRRFQPYGYSKWTVYRWTPPTETYYGNPCQLQQQPEPRSRYSKNY